MFLGTRYRVQGTRCRDCFFVKGFFWDFGCFLLAIIFRKSQSLFQSCFSDLSHFRAKGQNERL